MQCPNCGAFVEDGKAICTMCGAPLNNSQSSGANYGYGNNVYGQMAFDNNGFNNANAFNSNAYNQNYNNNFNQGPGQSFNNSNINNGGGFSNPSTNWNNQPSDYKNITYDTIQKDDRDIFDFFADNKKLISFFSFVLIIGLLIFAAYQYNKYKSKPLELEPKLLSLYFEVDSSLQSVSSNSQNTMVYTKSGAKGSSCSITISYGSATSNDHVKEYFTQVKKDLEPVRDNTNKIVNNLDIYTPSESNMKINDAIWYYLNIFYKGNNTSNPTLLKYKYLTSIYKGYYYDVELINNGNDSSCSASLDNFAKSLQFIDTEK